MSKGTAKILVLGDSGVGKTSLVNLICHSTVLNSAPSTIGCSIEVKLYENFFLEFWDIGGSRSHKIARSFLYQDYHGIILVFDATNNKSRLNLGRWLKEVNKINHIPIIKIATKKDLLPSNSLLEDQIIYVNTQEAISLENYDILNNFFKHVIEVRNKFPI